LSLPLQALDEPSVCERLDSVFGREWEQKSSCARCVTFTFPCSAEGNGAGNVTLHFWRTKCMLNMPVEGSRSTLKVTGEHLCAADERGAFLLNHRASFLTAALKGLGVGSDDSTVRNSYLSLSPSVSVLYLTGFDASVDRIAIAERESDAHAFSFLEYRPISDYFIRVYRIEPISITREDGEGCRSMSVYLLTLDHRGMALLAAGNLPDNVAFEVRLESHPSLTFAVDSVQRTALPSGVSFYYLNFDHFLSEKKVNMLKQCWGYEKRASVRLQRVLPVRISLSRYKKLYALTDDISCHGMRVVHKHAIPPGMHFECRIRLATVYGDVDLKSELVWKKTLMSTLNITGVKFIRSDSRELGRLRDYLESEIISDLKAAVCQDDSEPVSRP